MRSSSPVPPGARVIVLRAEAPAKPAAGQPCNGCGLCCLVEPCPLGQWVSRRRHGRCRALQWQPAESRYRCGLLSQPQRWLPRWTARWPGWRDRWLRRWIASGIGCDADWNPP